MTTPLTPSGSSPDSANSRLPARALLRAEELSVVDGTAAKLADLLRAKIPPAVLAVLRGEWLGHPLHPIMVTVPIGAWVAVPVLDVIGQRTAARHLLAFGIVASLPATATGLVEFTTLDQSQRRVAAVHVAANSVGISCLGRSWLRRRGDNTGGLGWTLAGLAFSGLGGALGGHLSYSQGAGVRRER